jgi:hypothetical protein
MLRRTTKIRLGVALSVSTVLMVAGVDISMGSSTDPTNRWACPPDKIGSSIADFGTGGGSATPEEAQRETLRFLARDGVASEEALLRAYASASGEDRFDATTGELRINNKIHVRMGPPVQLGDGTWVIATWQDCGHASPAVSGP